jgi:hypothetical protein
MLRSYIALDRTKGATAVTLLLIITKGRYVMKGKDHIQSMLNDRRP